METDQEQAGLAWQLGVWNRISDIYLREIDQRFAPVVDRLVARAALTAGQHVLDLGTGTGAVAESAAQMVGPQGQVVGVDLSPDMLALAQQRVAAAGLTNVRLCEGRAEALPAEDAAFDVVVASLSVMYVLTGPRQRARSRAYCVHRDAWWLPSGPSQRSAILSSFNRPRAVLRVLHPSLAWARAL
jgi:SAM-dependent methyltransferase